MREFLEKRENIAITVILLLGLCARLTWLIVQPNIEYAQGEVANAAIAFAHTGSIADVFGRGSGLTAHVNPIPSVFAGLVYKLLGVRSLQAEWLLASLSIAIALLTGLVFYQSSKLLGLQISYRLTFLALFCLLPLNFQLETTTFRIWEGGLAALIGALILCEVLRTEHAHLLSIKQWVWLSFLTALAFTLNPPLGVAYVSILGLLLLRRTSFSRAILLSTVSAAAFVLVLAPWTIRNYQAFGRIIPLRSNAGLELALANYPAAALTLDDRKTFVERLRQIHPLESQEAFHRMIATGDERAYADRLGKVAVDWISANPKTFLYLSSKHLTQFYFPPSWMWNVYTDTSRSTEFKTVMLWLIATLGLAGAIVSIRRAQMGFVYVALLAVIPGLPYAFFQPVLRYRYLIYAPTLLLAVYLIHEIMHVILEWRRPTLHKTEGS